MRASFPVSAAKPTSGLHFRLQPTDPRRNPSIYGESADNLQIQVFTVYALIIENLTAQPGNAIWSDDLTHFRSSDVIYFRLPRLAVVDFTTDSEVGSAISTTVWAPHMGAEVENRRKKYKSIFTFFNFDPSNLVETTFSRNPCAIDLKISGTLAVVCAHFPMEFQIDLSNFGQNYFFAKSLRDRLDSFEFRTS